MSLLKNYNIGYSKAKGPSHLSNSEYMGFAKHQNSRHGEDKGRGHLTNGSYYGFRKTSKFTSWRGQRTWPSA
jgi:hypothetical protein